MKKTHRVDVRKNLQSLAAAAALLACFAQQARAEDRSFQERFEEIAAAGNRIEILQDGEALHKKRMEIVKRAYRNIYVAQFSFNSDDAYVQEFLGVLCAKAKAGINVKMILDSFGTNRDTESELEELNRRCGINTLLYAPLEWGYGKIFHVLHTKLVIVDGRELIMGGSGFGEHYSKAGKDSGIWYDLDFHVFGSAACRFQRDFNDTYQWAIKIEEKWIRRSPKTWAADVEAFKKRYGTTLATCTEIPAGPSRIHAIFAQPLRTKKRPILDAYRDLISQARESVYMYAPFFAPLDEFLDLLRDAARRGVDVRILSNSWRSTDDRGSVSLEQFKALEKLTGFGGRAYQWGKKSTLHRKGMIVDGKWTVFGSDNLDRRGQNYSAESVAITDDPEIARAMTETYLSDLLSGEELTPLQCKAIQALATIRNRIEASLLKDVF